MNERNSHLTELLMESILSQSLATMDPGEADSASTADQLIHLIALLRMYAKTKGIPFNTVVSQSREPHGIKGGDRITPAALIALSFERHDAGNVGIRYTLPAGRGCVSAMEQTPSKTLSWTVDDGERSVELVESLAPRNIGELRTLIQRLTKLG